MTRGKTKTASLKAEFDAAHKDGVDALKRRDYSAVREVIQRERKVINAVSEAVKRKTTKRAK
jgi:hypothetical protein